MSDQISIKRALLSVSDKTDLMSLAEKLCRYDVEIISTGGTARALKSSGISSTDVAEITGFPEIMGGRVKTLHPKIHGGLLGKRDDKEHQTAMKDNDILPIDLLVCNLYPFEKTVKTGSNFDACIENIDIGGPAMIRAAAKNYESLTVIIDPVDYDALLGEIEKYKGSTSLEFRKKLAAEAFSRTAAYDSEIANWFSNEVNIKNPRYFTVTGSNPKTLRYGENPHQSASLYKTSSDRKGVGTAIQIQGKELSYNNLNDTDAAFELVAEFDEPAVAIIKHANPCGVAIGTNVMEAYQKALQCDQTSAFGGIIAINAELTGELATEISKIFTEVIIAPHVTEKAKKVLMEKKDIRVLETGGLPNPRMTENCIKRIAGGFLLQDGDSGMVEEEQLQIVTERRPNDKELKDLLIAYRIAKHVKSNAIVYVKDGASVGIGAGQMSRVDASRMAASKAKDASRALGLEKSISTGSVVASDAFFPFADGLLSAIEAGATAVIQPGGSVRDQEVINAANEKSIAMVMTGIRNFRH